MPNGMARSIIDLCVAQICSLPSDCVLLPGIMNERSPLGRLKAPYRLVLTLDQNPTI
jgi:hypothetical protein